MQQYYVHGIIKVNESFIFDKEQTHHIKDVLRMKEGTCVRLVNADQDAGFASIHYVDKEVAAVIEEMDDIKNEMRCQITLCMGLIKKEKWDYLLQKCTELGVVKIVPFESNRTVVKTKDEKIIKKLDRWNKIVLEASEQSKRNRIPSIEEPIQFKEIIRYKSELNCVAYEDMKYSGTKLRDTLTTQKQMTVVIGPEGGFDTTEISYLVEQGFICISLGKRILRAETAATYVLSAIDSLVE